MAHGDNGIQGSEGGFARDGNALTGVLGGNAFTGKVMAEVNQERFNPTAKSALDKVDVAPVVMNKESVFSTDKAQPQANPEAKAMLTGMAVTGDIKKSDTSYSMKDFNVDDAVNGNMQKVKNARQFNTAA